MFWGHDRHTHQNLFSYFSFSAFYSACESDCDLRCHDYGCLGMDSRSRHCDPLRIVFRWCDCRRYGHDGCIHSIHDYVRRTHLMIHDYTRRSVSYHANDETPRDNYSEQESVCELEHLCQNSLRCWRQSQRVKIFLTSFSRELH